MKTIQITFDDDLHSRAKLAAHKAKTTLGDFVRAAVSAYLQQLEAPSGEATCPTGGAT